MREDISLFDSDKGIQTKLLAILFRSPSSWSFSGQLKPHHLDGEIFMEVARKGLQYIEKERVLPTREVMKRTVYEYCSQKKKSEEETDRYTRLIAKIYSADITDAPFFVSRITEFLKRQASIHAITNYVKDGKIDDLMPRLQEAMGIGSGVSPEQRLDFLEGFEKRLETYKNWNREVRADKIPTPWPKMTDLLDGGFATGELWAVMGDPGGGKTTILVACATEAAIFNGIPTLYFSHELPKVKLERRADRYITKMGKKEILKNPDAFAEKFLAQYKKSGNFAKLQIEFMPPVKTKVQDIINRYEQYKQTAGFYPKFIIDDYPLKLSSRRDYGESQWAGPAEIYLDLFSWSSDSVRTDNPFSLLVACQPTRESMGKSNKRLKDAGKTIDITHIADGLIAIARSSDEIDSNRGRLQLLKNRDDPGNREIDIHMNIDRMILDEEATDVRPT